MTYESLNHAAREYAEGTAPNLAFLGRSLRRSSYLLSQPSNPSLTLEHNSDPSLTLEHNSAPRRQQ
jgi:hypothetical protein